MRRFKLLIISTLMCLGMAIPFSVQAQQIDLTVGPPKLEIFIKPDTQASIPYTITNRADSIGLRPLIRKFSMAKDGKSVVYESIEKFPIKMSVVDENLESVGTFVVNKGSSKKIYLQIDVPASVQEGEYHLSFIIESQPDFLDKQYSARIKSQIASPLLITVTKTGKTEVRGEISEFSIANKIFDSFAPIPVVLKVKNLGKNSLVAGGSITVRGSFGESATYPLQDRNVLTNSEKLMASKFIEDDATLVLKGFFLGRYGVSTSVVLADGTMQLNRSTSFFAFPFKIVLIAVLGSFVGIMLLKKRG